MANPDRPDTDPVPGGGNKALPTMTREALNLDDGVVLAVRLLDVAGDVVVPHEEDTRAGRWR